MNKSDLEKYLLTNTNNVIVSPFPDVKIIEQAFKEQYTKVLKSFYLFTTDFSLYTFENFKAVIDLNLRKIKLSIPDALAAYSKAPKRGINPLIICAESITIEDTEAIKKFYANKINAKDQIVLVIPEDYNVNLENIKRQNIIYLISDFMEDYKLKSNLVYKIENTQAIVGMAGLTNWLIRRKACFLEDYGIKIKGISVFGIPGTGKTISAFRCGEVFGCDVYNFDIHSCLDSYLGNSEKNVDAALAKVKSLGRVVVLIDEIDKMFSYSKNSNDGGVSSRILKKLLSFMNDNKDSFFVITGNSVKNVPSELIRRGRLNEYFYADLPIASDFTNFIKEKLNTYKIEKSAKTTLYKALDEKTYMYVAKNYTYADLNAIIDECVIDVINVGTPDVSSHIENTVSGFNRNKEDYEYTIEWGRKNARNIN